MNLQRQYWRGFAKYLLMSACICERITTRYFGTVRTDKFGELKRLLSEWASSDVVQKLEELRSLT